MRIQWHGEGDRVFEAGVDRGVLFVRDETGYGDGVAWNGLTAVNETPGGAESNKQYADNREYLNLVSDETFSGTIEAFTYPDEFELCDGTAEVAVGVTVGQQRRRTFGLSYRTLLGNDVLGTDYGYKLHLVWGAQAAPSEKSRATINESPEATQFSWEFTTSPVEVAEGFKPTSHMVINSTKVAAADLKALEDLIYGVSGDTPADPVMPTPAEVIEIFGEVVVP